MWRVARYHPAILATLLGASAAIADEAPPPADAAIRLKMARHPRLVLAGNAFDGVGIPDCIRSAQDAADTVLTALADPATPAAA